MNRHKEDDSALLYARLGDALQGCRRGQTTVLSFLTPREKKRLEAELCRLGVLDAAWFYGGYEGAERTALFLLPDYLRQACDGAPDSIRALLGDAVEETVGAVRISGSRYRTLTHRDYLGSVLGLGLERDAIGDIVVQNDFEAVIFCGSRIADFLCRYLEKVASDTVRCARYLPDEYFTDGKRYHPIFDTVASPRLDCVVAALTNSSREEAKKLVQVGLVEVEYEIETRTDFVLEPPMTLSVRGYGRFVLRAFDGETKKGRLRLRAEKFI